MPTLLLKAEDVTGEGTAVYFSCRSSAEHRRRGWDELFVRHGSQSVLTRAKICARKEVECVSRARLCRLSMCDGVLCHLDMCLLAVVPRELSCRRGTAVAASQRPVNSA